VNRIAEAEIVLRIVVSSSIEEKRALQRESEEERKGKNQGKEKWYRGK